jgi:putative lipoprotein
MKWALAFHLAVGSPHDSFLGADKLKHFLISAFIESVTYAGLRTARVSPGPALGAAATLTAAVGIGKEIRDVKAEGQFSVGDLTWDLVGTAAAAVVLNQTTR